MEKKNLYHVVKLSTNDFPRRLCTFRWRWVAMCVYSIFDMFDLSLYTKYDVCHEREV